MIWTALCLGVFLFGLKGEMRGHMSGVAMLFVSTVLVYTYFHNVFSPSSGPATKMFTFGFAFFIGLPGAAQVLTGKFYWGAASYSDAEYWIAFLIFSTFVGVFFAVSSPIDRRLRRLVSLGPRRTLASPTVQLHQLRVFIFFSIACAFSAALILSYLYFQVGPASIFGTRYTSMVAFETSGSLNTTVMGLTKSLGRQLALLGFGGAIIVWLISRSSNRHFHSVAFLLVAGSIALLANYPSSTPRTHIFAMLLLAGFVVEIQRVSPLRWFYLVFPAAFYSIAPLMRNFNRGSNINFDVAIPSFAEVITHGDLDAYQQLLNAVQFTGETGHKLGIQNFSAIFFFIPRSIWPHKAEPSGQIVAEHMGYIYTNLSMPMPAEAWIDFGLFGVILFAVMLALAVKLLEHAERARRSTISLFLTLSLVATAAYAPIMLRGSAMAAASNVAVAVMLPLVVSLALKLTASRGDRNSATVPSVRRVQIHK
ncbi:O-antigen polymerase [Pyruvatibacter sp.]|uniref:O-antigen polymerase n=1 Tax=Pyruvatibacter sp. TaxID=1981328 RepID=UPI0032EB3635